MIKNNNFEITNSKIVLEITNNTFTLSKQDNLTNNTSEKSKFHFGQEKIVKDEDSQLRLTKHKEYKNENEFMDSLPKQRTLSKDLTKGKNKISHSNSKIH